MPVEDRRFAGQLILSLSLATLCGIFSGISLSENHILSPKNQTRSISDGKYLRSASVTEVNAIDIEYNHQVITAKEAYEDLHRLVVTGSAK